ncbi:MAG TPA: hypothetical protein VGL75_00925 [Acidothermaceae bacterium]|jgi:hypothetical protein
MPSLGLTAQDNALTDFIGRYTWISVHTGDPGATGANEAAYTSGGRQQVSWPAVVSHQVAWVGQLTFLVPIGTYLYYGIWDSASGGVFANGQLLDASRPFLAAGALQLNLIILAAQ